MDDLTSLLRPRSTNRALPWVVALVLMASASMALLLAYQSYVRLETASLMRERLDRLAARKLAPPSRAVIEDAKRWEALALERGFDWHRVFDSIERVGNPDINLLVWEPDKANRKIAVRGEAKNDKALIAFIESLSIDSALKHVHLVRRQPLKRGDTEAVAFEIRATLL